MTALPTLIKNNFDNIFTGFASCLSQYGTGDKQVANWKIDDMSEIKGQSRLVLRPVIVKHAERQGLLNTIVSKYADNSTSTNPKLKTEIAEKILDILGKHASLKDKELNIETTYKAEQSISGSVKTFSIKVTLKGGSQSKCTISFTCKSTTKGIKKPDPHELMTACLILKKIKVNQSALNKDSKTVYSKVKSIVDACYDVASSVQGGSGLGGFYMDTTSGKGKEPDMVNFAKAYSASNYILDALPTNYSNVVVYQTGQKWHSNIAGFAKNDQMQKEIKAYNSSDIVVEFTTGTGTKKKTHFWGISLKKRGINSKMKPDREPTLLNKPVIDILKNYASTGEMGEIEKAKTQFFRQALKIKYNLVKAKSNNELLKTVNSMSAEDILKHCNEQFEGDEKSLMLRGQGKYSTNRNIYFEEIHKVFMKNCNGNPKFFWEFIDLVFRVDIDAFVSNANFHFSLITGTGDFDCGTQKFRSETALEKYGKTTTNVFTEMFQEIGITDYRTSTNNNPDFQIIEGTGINAFEENSTAAKLFYTMKIGKYYIVDLEVRYKGSLTSQPQFQVFMSLREPNFSTKYKTIANTPSAPNKDRWK